MLMLYFRILSEWVPIIIITCVLWIFVTAFLFCLLRTWVRRHGRSQLPHLRTPGKDRQHPLVVGLFHPYCNAGGGGERVLWVAVRALQNKYPNVQCVVYTGDTDTTGPDIIRLVRQRFNMVLPRSVEFVFLNRRSWVEAKPYPYFTLLGQSLGSLVLGWEALTKCVPDVYIDTMGYAFTVPLFRYLGGCRVGAYVHYPTISTDMLDRVAQRTAAHNNDARISRSPVLSYAKLLYYKLFAYLYGVAGKRCDVVMVNSSWTQGHILDLWQSPGTTHIVYPPCDTKEFLQLPLRSDTDQKTHSIVSVAQFRPEKDHPLQVRAFSRFLAGVPEDQRHWYRLVLVGGCRHEEDRARVTELRTLCSELGVENSVDFKLNVSFSELKDLMSQATVGLHTMWNEHFGIGVVELMAAGTVILAHNSGGPKMDIVTPHNGHSTGFLADSEESYAAAMQNILSLSPKQRTEIRTNARLSVNRFSEEQFEKGFLDATHVLFQL